MLTFTHINYTINEKEGTGTVTTFLTFIYIEALFYDINLKSSRWYLVV